ncbi:triosephosphate isomerase [Escherichia coli]|nr:triosephosphate isomerase [Escherichia coli]TII49204.1 triosephosphate isomerase [Escherichia coli]
MTKSKAFVPMNLYTVSQTCCPAGRPSSFYSLISVEN